MTVTDLLVDLGRLGIRLEAAGDRLRFHPRSAVTPDLAARLKAHKAALVALLRPAANDPWKPLFGLGATPLAIGPDGWPVGSIDPDEVTPCPECSTYQMWQTLAGNWRCQRCDPPTTAWRWAELAERIRRREGRKTDTGRKGQY